MTRKNRSPEESARRAKIRGLLLSSNISSMDDIQDLFKETIAEFMGSGLEAELDDELGYGRYDYRNKDTNNSRNGHSSKTLRTSYGDVEVAVPRDRKGEFEPQILKKNQTSISQDIEEKILSMYAKGMTTGDIEAHVQDIYGIEVSDTTISRITDKILPPSQRNGSSVPWRRSTLWSFWTPSTTTSAVKDRSVFPTDDSLFKMLYLAMVDITKKWTGRQRDWSMIHAQLSIYFAERMPE